MKVRFKKTALTTVFVGISFSALADNNGVGGYWVRDLIPNAQAIQSTLMQRAIGATNACGPTSLLFVSNHYRRLDTGQNSPNMSSVTASQGTLAKMYKFINVSYNHPSGTDLTQLRNIARGVVKPEEQNVKLAFGWGNVVRMSGEALPPGSIPDRVSINMDNLIDYLNRNIPAIGVLHKDYPGNPVGKGVYHHIVILYAYNRQKDEFGRAPFDPKNTRNLDTIDWYEPYDGKQGRVLRKDVGTAFFMANFSFLAVGR